MWYLTIVLPPMQMATFIISGKIVSYRLQMVLCPTSRIYLAVRCPDKIGQSRIKQPEQFSNTSC